MAAVSFTLHGLIVATASIWPTSPALVDPFSGPVVCCTDPLPEFPGFADPPASTPTVDDPAPTPPPLADPVADDIPPVAELPDMLAPSAPPALRHALAPTRPILAVHTLPSANHARPGATGVTTPHSSIGGSAGPRFGPVGAWKTSNPPYPYSMRAARVQGSGRVRITTDSSGRVVEALIVQSTSSTVLDENTCRYARGSWSGPANAITTVSITYQFP